MKDDRTMRYCDRIIEQYDRTEEVENCYWAVEYCDKIMGHCEERMVIEIKPWKL